MSWLNPTADERKLAQEYKPAAGLDADPLNRYRLLQVLALALRIEPRLLRNARLHFAPGSDTEWETDIWFSPLMRSRTAKSALMREGSARTLVDDLVNDPAEFNKAWVFVRMHTRHWPEADRLEQELRLAAVNNDQNALKKGFARILKTIEKTTNDHERREWARWVKGALPGLTPESGAVPEVGWLQQYIAAVLSSTGQAVQRNSAAVPMPGWLIKALPKTGGQSLFLRLRPGVLECLKEEDDLPCHEIKVSLPLPTPLLLTENNDEPRWEGFWPGRRIRVGKSLETLLLQTLKGERYRFTVQQDDQDPDRITEPGEIIVLAFLPQDRNAARQIAGILDSHKIKVKLVEDDPENPPVPSAAKDTEPVRLIRLWTRNAADFWQKRSGHADWRVGEGLLLRTDTNAALPEGLVPARVVDLSDWEKGISKDTTESLLEAVTRFLENPEPEPESEEKFPEDTRLKDQAEIDRLLKEIADPKTEPTRRLAIGDRLAELGDPRPGVGVREIEFPVATEGSSTPAKKDFAPEIQRLLDEINDIKTEPPRRLEIGDELARLGDPRKGVGLDAKGLPDIDWVEIPGGGFNYQDGQKLELPTFYIARYPVTNAQFQAFVDSDVYEDERWWRNLKKPKPQKSNWGTPNRPRTNVDSYEAIAFCRWLSVALGLEENAIRLPTEQEWEKAARGEKGLVYPWGNGYRSGYANIDERYNKAGSWYLEQTTAVGLYPHGASPYGVQDLSGNVWEWCLNRFDKPDVVAPDADGDRRVLRGGSWNFNTDGARSDNRYWDDPGNCDYNRGFRVLSSVPIR